MSYRGKTEEALRNLTKNVRERLAKAGLSTWYEALAYDKEHGAVIQAIEHWEKALTIIHEEIEKFRKDQSG